MRRILLALLAILLLLGAFAWYNGLARTDVVPLTQSSGYTKKPISLGNTNINADIADTESLRQLGLSGRESLAEDRGMLFVFQDDDPHSFWMKDMLFPIDIIWLSSDKKVIYIAKNAKPESYPSSYRPTDDSRYVIEVPSGFSDRHNISVGSNVSF